LVEPGTGRLGYFRALALLPDDRIVTAGSFQVPDPNFVDNYDLSVARWKTDGTPDPTFAGDGWRTFNVANTRSAIDGIEKLALAPGGKLVFAGHYEVGGDAGTNVVFGRLDDAGNDDATFGDPATPGFRTIDPVPGSWNESATGLVRQSDGRFVATVSYSVFDPMRENMAAVRLTADGALDPTFATNGVFDRDLGHGGYYDDAMALTLDAGRALIAGRSAQPPSAGMVDTAVLRLTSDLVFRDGVDE
ncbi:MAG TPA: delta-60 repeat domain-containing protein, partial [Tahibacter sp.]|nr:delta-60 repeat domain-containing protein [Tahibacter sp.]